MFNEHFSLYCFVCVSGVLFCVHCTQSYGGGGGGVGHYAGGHAPPMSLPCMTTTEQNKEFSVPCAQDDILNKLESDKLK